MGEFDPMTVTMTVRGVKKSPPANDVENAAATELRMFVERIQRLDEEEQTIKDDKSDVYGEAKSRGYDRKALRRVVQALKKDRNERMEEEGIFRTYMAALGEDV
jgi:uncharacterized protein (UPF0335 family)